MKDLDGKRIKNNDLVMLERGSEKGTLAEVVMGYRTESGNFISADFMIDADTDELNQKVRKVEE